MYQTNMPYNHFNKYVNALIEKELLGIKSLKLEGEKYYTTEKGNELIRSIDIVMKFLK